jgi:acetyl esterase
MDTKTGGPSIFAPKGPFVTELPDPPGLSHFDPNGPAAPYYELLAQLRHPLTLREMMIKPVRDGYIGKPGEPLPKDMPPSADALYPQVRVQEIGVPCADGTIRCKLYTPPGDASGRPVVLYLHGGGFMVGSAADTASITSRIAAKTGCAVVSVDYRMAPEWPFPYAIDDGFAVLRWLREHAGLIGGDPKRILVAGDSAGGNLAAAMPLVARDRGAGTLLAAVLLCPITNFFAEQYESFERLAPHGIIYDTPFFGFARGAYLPHQLDWSEPYASPALADIGDYPPTLVVSGTADPMIDDNRAFVAKLRAAGVSVQGFERENMPHGYYFFPGLLKQGEEALAAVDRFIAERV